MTDEITVVLVDDHLLMREGLREILEIQPDIRVVGEAGDSTSAVEVVAEHQPRVVLLDVEIPGDEVTTTVTRMHQVAPNTEIIILSMYDGPHLLQRLLALGIRPELVVCNPIGEPFQPATFSGMWKDWADAHGFAGITFHGLRHGAATLLLAAGVSDTVAMRTMGHADTRILARYQDVVSELQRDAAARMDALLGHSI